MASAMVSPGRRLAANAGFCLVPSRVLATSRADDAIQPRDGLADCFRVLAEAQRAAQPARMVCLGGSITKGQGATGENRGFQILGRILERYFAR